MIRPPARPQSLSAPSHARVARDWKVLCTEIGDRRAGGSGERRAIEHLLECFSRAGLDAHQEPVPCQALELDSRCAVSGLVGGRWVDCAARELVGSASTPGGRRVDGEITWIEMPEMARALTPRNCRGKVVMLFGPLPDDPGQYRRLVRSGATAVLQIDDRLPYTWPRSDALYPYWTKLHGAVPTVSIPYQVAWQWKTAGVKRVRVSVNARHRPAVSGNVVATLRGTNPRLPGLMVTAHHDTQPATVGADDNASGVVCLLELARLLAAHRPMPRTIEFVSFGAEEQLSVGAAHYVRRHHAGLGKVGLVVNFDSVASPLGHFWLFHSGQPNLGTSFQSALGDAGLDVALDNQISPFGDHFPFAASGVPAVWLYRSNVNGGHRWQHHSQQDSLEHVSADVACTVIRATGTVVAQLAEAGDWPWRRALPSSARAETARLARELFGLRP